MNDRFYFIQRKNTENVYIEGRFSWKEVFENKTTLSFDGIRNGKVVVGIYIKIYCCSKDAWKKDYKEEKENMILSLFASINLPFKATT